MKNEKDLYLDIQEKPSSYEVKSRLEYIKEKISLSPSQSGCYIWKDEKGKVLYIGKSIDIKKRLKSYLKPDDYKHFLLLEKAYDIDWIITNNGNEALILEDNLIKEYQPPFNVRLKDDKRYPFLCISLNETYPRIFITRKYKKDGNRYFGPYTDAKFARQLLDLIHKTFPIRKVNQELPLKKIKRPCMNFFIKRCLAPCQGNVSPEEYKKIVQEIILFLEGRKELLEEIILKRMNEYSINMEYEKAAIYRDILIKLKQYQEKQDVIKPGNPDQDVVVVGINEEYRYSNAVVLEFRNAKLISKKSFSLYVPPDIKLSEYKKELLSSFLREYYLHLVNQDQFPAKIVIPYKVEGLDELQEFLKNKFNYDISISIHPNTSVIQLAEKNAELLLKEKILGLKNKLKKDGLNEIKEICKLNQIPEIIECYDISHFQGNEIVGSGVRFLNGEPNPSSYRHYIIKTLTDINDPAAIKEVIDRRIRRLKEEHKTYPDLIVIDGGITQVNAAYDALQQHGVNIPLIGLAKKREEIYFPHNSKPITPDPNSSGMLILRHMRDEAHRFAITHQRKRMQKLLYKHVLDNIPNIGNIRKQKILKYLNEIPLKELEVDDLTKIEGIGKKLANLIIKKIQEP